ncbi:MAG TPA: hypothetical protein VLN59_13540 [Burkholderiales bacterium]|nr:hypothetical protein [Burkholderiales bacterium]
MIAPASLAQSSAASGARYYVATNGSDADPGTLDRPWRTIQKAANTVGAGSTVYVRGGVYHERVTIHVSGVPGQPIVFQSHPGEQAIIDGTGLTPPAGWSALIDIRDKGHLVIQGFEICHYHTAQKNHLPMGIFVTGAVIISRFSTTKSITSKRTSPAGRAVMRMASRSMGRVPRKP